MKDQPELLPCPFCGGTGARFAANGIGDVYVICDGEEREDMFCGASTSEVRCESEATAAARWNRRSLPSQAHDIKGWRYVPVEPTPAMKQAAINLWFSGANKDFVTLYRAMLSAAPIPLEGE